MWNAFISKPKIIHDQKIKKCFKLHWSKKSSRELIHVKGEIQSPVDGRNQMVKCGFGISFIGSDTEDTK